MDNNINNTAFTSCEDDDWMYMDMDISSFLPISTEPLIKHNMQGIEMPTIHSYMNCGESEEICLALTPTTPPFTESPLESVLPSTASRPFVNAAAAQSSAPITASRKPKAPKSKEPKIKASPKYKINPDDCKTEKEKKSVLHAKKCKKARMRKAQEIQTLVQTNVHLTNQVHMLTEQLREATEKVEALTGEVERCGQVIVALSWDVAIKMCSVNESQPQ